MGRPDRIAIATRGYRCGGDPNKVAIATYGYRCQVEVIIIPVKRGGSTAGMPLPQFPPDKVKEAVPEWVIREDTELIEFLTKAVEVASANS